MKVWLVVTSFSETITAQGVYSTEERANERVVALALDDDVAAAGYHIARLTVDEGIDGIGWKGND